MKGSGLLMLVVGIVLVAVIGAAGAARGENRYEYPDSYGDPLYAVPYPPEIFDYCIDRFGTRDLKAADCMRYENSMKQRAEAFLRREIKDPALRDRLYANCYDQWGHRGMKWVDHCVRTNVNYSNTHGGQ